MKVASSPQSQKKSSWNPIKSFQWDLARQMERLDVLLELLPRYAGWGYQELYLHLEDAVYYPSVPNVARKDAMTTNQFQNLVETASKLGIKTVPIVNLLGHTQYLINEDDLRDLNELRDESGGPLERGQICPLHPRTLEIAEKLIGDMAPFCTAGKMHVGLDESFHLGKCPRCRAEIKSIGLGAHFSNYVAQLHRIVGKHGLEMGLWADMLYYIPEAIPSLPRGITAYEWYYYPFDRKPRVELYNFREMDIHPSLKKAGIKYYGCPMNGAFRWEPLPTFTDRLENMIAWWDRGKQLKADGYLVTSWEPNRLSFELTTAMDAAVASLWLNPGVTSPKKMLELGFARFFGASAKKFAAVALGADRYPYAGYWRWQTNDRWDVAGPNESVKRWTNEATHFLKLERSAAKAPESLKCSLALRSYLAKRDLFIRETAQTIFDLRGSKPGNPKNLLSIRKSLNDCRSFAVEIKIAERAANIIWKKSRDASVKGPNRIILERDAIRLKDLQAWLKEALKNPNHLFTSSSVAAAWSLHFTAINFAPAIQRVAIEQQEADGRWKTVYAPFLIEFQAFAARRHTYIEREHSIAISWDGHSNPPTLRIAARGIGSLKVRDIFLCDGQRTIQSKNLPGMLTLGTQAPKKGFPAVDWNENTDIFPLPFETKKRRPVFGSPLRVIKKLPD